MPLRLSGIRAVVFDLDDTLFPESAYALSGLSAVGQWLSARMPCPCDPAARLIEMFRAGRRYTLFDDLLAEWGWNQGGELVSQMVACYRDHAPEIQLHADAERAIGRWRSMMRLGLITDGPLASQRRKVEALGLEQRLNRVLCTDAWGQAFWKPHPRAFETLQREWNLEPAVCVYIADNPSKDFIAPNALGWASLQIRRADGEYSSVTTPPGGEPRAIVSSMDEIDLTS